MRLPSIAVSLFVLALAACAPPEEDADSNEGAFSVAQGDLASMRDTAQRIADRIGKHDRSVSLFPLTAAPPDSVRSAKFGGWNLALFSAKDGDALRTGFLLLPQKGAPASSFGIVLASEERKIVAVAAYVPDSSSAKADAASANAILDGIASDAPRFVPLAGGSTTPKTLASAAVKTAFEVLGKLVVAAEVKAAPAQAKVAAATAESFVASKVSSTLWRSFAALFDDPKLVARYATELVTVRKLMAERKIVLVETFDLPKGGPVLDQVAALYDAKLGARSKEIAIAIRGSEYNNSAILRWALEHDVPVVMSTPSKSGAEALAKDALAYDRATKAFFESAAKDPQKAGLIRTVDGTLGVDGSNEVQLREFAPVWAVADEALALKFRYASDKVEVANGGFSSDCMSWFDRWFRTAATEWVEK